MAEKHDNTKPAKTGAYTIGQNGKLTYFPIEQGGYLRPAMALVIFEDTNGKTICRIDTVWPDDSSARSPILDEE